MYTKERTTAQFRTKQASKHPNNWTRKQHRGYIVCKCTNDDEERVLAQGQGPNMLAMRKRETEMKRDEQMMI